MTSLSVVLWIERDVSKLRAHTPTKSTHLNLGVRLQTEPLGDRPKFVSRLTCHPHPRASQEYLTDFGERPWQACASFGRSFGRAAMEGRERASPQIHKLADNRDVPWPTRLFLWDCLRCWCLGCPVIAVLSAISESCILRLTVTEIFPQLQKR